MLRRRVVSIPAVLLTAFILLSLLPVLVVVSLLLALFPRLRTTPHALGFAYGYLFYEIVGICWLGWLWLRYRNDPTYLARNQQIQYWWTAGLLYLGVRLYRLTFDIGGAEAVEGPSALMIPRHTSIGDTDTSRQ